MTAKTLRTKVFARLEADGFRPAPSLPLPDMKQIVRPPAEIAARLMTLDALFTWVSYPRKDVPSKRIEGYIQRNGLRDWMAEEEAPIVGLSRDKAFKVHGNTIGWKLENMWALAWVLGFDPEPAVEAAQVDESITRPLIYDFLPGLEATVEQLLAKAALRKTEEVIALEYRFYCAHNAVRSAQLGGKTVPRGFHPIVHGGAVHERRHSLTWSLSPGVAWEETDLST
jgi:hypothetical protein